ncbi:MAG: AAA family ATPase [Clostridia bacterium]|nr:AAA family ATPase [Clostridia bacterium]
MANGFISELAKRIQENVSKVIIGKDQEIRLLLTSIIARGHVLMEDVPGTGKTVLAKSLARSIDCSFSRIQFTPDLLPGDVTGLSVFDAKKAEFVFKPGPVFTNVLLADEINRATPRTQSALLECMEERQVTADGVTRKLSEPFLVIATQNPIETQGTFPLPEAQLDRFLMKLKIGHLSHEDAVRVLDRFIENDPLQELMPVCTIEEMNRAQKEFSACEVSKPVREYIASVTEFTRLSKNVVLGVSPRGMLQLMRACQAYALIEGRSFVTPDDVKALAIPVLAHRVVVRGAYGETNASEEAVKEALEKAQTPTEQIGRESDR